VRVVIAQAEEWKDRQFPASAWLLQPRVGKVYARWTPAMAPMGCRITVAAVDLFKRARRRGHFKSLLVALCDLHWIETVRVENVNNELLLTYLESATFHRRAMTKPTGYCGRTFDFSLFPRGSSENEN